MAWPATPFSRAGGKEEAARNESMESIRSVLARCVQAFCSRKKYASAGILEIARGSPNPDPTAVPQSASTLHSVDEVHGGHSPFITVLITVPANILGHLRGGGLRLVSMYHETSKYPNIRFSCLLEHDNGCSEVRRMLWA